MEITQQQITAVFAEWKRQFEESPEDFMANGWIDEAHAEDCAEYFIRTLGELHAAN